MICKVKLCKYLHIFISLLFLSHINAAYAAESKEKVCSNIAKKAQRTLWDPLKEAANESYCRKPWVERSPGEFLACTGVNKTIKFSSKLKDRWNRFFQRQSAEWATWGARGIAEPWELGTIRGGYKRTFFGVGMAQSESIIEIQKRGGRSAANITVCELNQAGRVVRSHRRTFPKGKKIPSPRKVVIENGNDTRIIAVVVDTAFGTKDFEYKARLANNPIKNNIGPVAGIADLHVHQFADIAFGARMMWGAHDGPVETALAPEQLSTNNPKGVMEVVEQLGNVSLDANILMYMALGSKNKDGLPTKSDEGFVTLSTGGFPYYTDWPHHADRSHQQAHISWLEEAVMRNRKEKENLSLMVLSIVHNDILCKVYKAFDPYGNVPIRNSQGRITGWKSASWKCEDDESVKLQLNAAHALERKYPWYRIALNPWHARQIIKDGHLAVVVSLETDKPLSDQSGKYSNWEHTLDFYRSKGVTTLQVVHESDSIFCGAAQHRNMMKYLQGLHSPINSIVNKTRNKTPFDLHESGERRGQNKLGVTPDGEKLIDAMVARHMPIDLAHGSVRCREGIISRVPKDYGLYDSHTKFEKLLQTAGANLNELNLKSDENFPPYSVIQREKTFVVREDMIDLYRDNKVLLGLRTASIDVDTAPAAPGDPSIHGYKNDCPGSAQSFAQQVKYANDKDLLFAYGTDFNTGVSQLGPRFGKERCYASHPGIKVKERTNRPVGDAPPIPARAESVRPIAGTNYYFDGLATIGWLPELTNDLRAMGVPGADKLTNGAENYIQMWQRTYEHGPTKSGYRPADSYGIGECKKDNDCRRGEFCSTPVFGKNACLAKIADGKACTTKNHCRSGFCNVRCYTPKSLNLSQSCYVSDQCKVGKCSGTGWGAISGKCVCNSDWNCGNGRYCNKGVGGIGANVCKPKLSQGQWCSRKHQCKSGCCKVYFGKLQCRPADKCK